MLKGNIMYTIHGWKQKSESTGKWKAVSEDMIVKKITKLMGRSLSEEEWQELRVNTI
jgi:hypothetical protein